MIIFPPAFTESVVEHLTGGAVVGDPLTDLVHKLPVRSVPRGGECAAGCFSILSGLCSSQYACAVIFTEGMMDRTVVVNPVTQSSEKFHVAIVFLDF